MTRSTLDQYFTPSAVIRPVVEQVMPYLQAGPVVEPSFGGGDVLRELAPHCDTSRLVGIELDRFCVDAARAAGVPGRLVHADYLQFDAARVRPALIVGNPPYLHAEAFVRRALQHVAPNGAVAFLLRLGFLASRTRYDLMAEQTPDVTVLAERPSFTADGKTDNSEYAWFVWHRARPARSAGQVRVISWKGVA